MTMTSLDAQSLASRPARSAFDVQGWINVVMAALAMTATLPGRTQGLALITEALTADPILNIGNATFAVINGWAIVLGAVLCWPAGRLIDRYGVRAVSVLVAGGLGLAVIGMSAATNVVLLIVTLTLVRGLGQGALSVVSLAMIGKWFTRKLPWAMGVFMVLVAFGLATAIIAAGQPVQNYGWRRVWAGLGISLLIVLAPLSGLLVRNAPNVTNDAPTLASTGLTLGAALCTPAFWAFTLATSFFNLAFSALTLFNESILKHQGFDRDTFLLTMAVLFASGLLANLFCGWLATRWPLGRLLCAGMILLAVSLAAFPFATETIHVVFYAIVLGAAGGVITVVFFAVYAHAFGRLHLGAIQACVQVVTVLASALGPVLLQEVFQKTGSYDLFFQVSAVFTLTLGLLVWWVHLPKAEV